MACILRRLVKTSLTRTSMRLRARGDAESGGDTSGPCDRNEGKRADNPMT